jgi:transmembrane sensor
VQYKKIYIIEFMTPKRSYQTGNTDRQSKAFFTGGSFFWSKSQEKIWSEMESRLSDRTKERNISLNRYTWAIAAGILLLVGLGSFFRFYSVTIESPAGIHKTALLPDGSKFELNAVSSIRYHPFFLKLNREVILSGEAHFEVTHGKKFAVLSVKGKTEVLGTTFNIYARGNSYQVTCLTGRVKVTSLTRKVVVLHPETRAEILNNGEIQVSEKIDTFPVISWRNNIFLFTAKPVKEVFSEIERQYNITIHSNVYEYVRYTGNFTKEQNVEEILGYICPALDLTYTRKSTDVYNITRANE